MNATIYKVDSTKGSWKCILEELGLPTDTDQITVKAISHVTKSQRETKKTKFKRKGQKLIRSWDKTMAAQYFTFPAKKGKDAKNADSS